MENATGVPTMATRGLPLRFVVMLGDVDVIVTLKLPEVAFPLASVAVQLTTVGPPTGNTDPELAPQTTLAAEQRSSAVTTNETAAPAGLVHSCVMSAGTKSEGRTVSTTLTPKDGAVAGLPVPSVAMQLTVVSPIGNTVPGDTDTEPASQP
jgi:hypothetical protein